MKRQPIGTEIYEMPIVAAYDIRYLPCPMVLDIPTKDQYREFIVNRGDQYFSLSMETYENKAESAYYGEMAVYYWNEAQIVAELNDWTFNLWFENNEEFIYNQYQNIEWYIAPEIKPSLFNTIRNLFTPRRQAVAA